MARAKKTTPQVKKATKQKKRLAINGSMLTDVQPLTPNQERIFSAWKEGKHMFIYVLSKVIYKIF